MSDKTDDPVAERLQRFWQKLLDATLRDMRAKHCDDATVAKLSESMMHVAIAKYAQENGAAQTARELYLVSLKFRETADREAAQAALGKLN